jgi:hypothetical protein
VRYFYDTEFLEDGKTIELISIGIVCEDGCGPTTRPTTTSPCASSGAR